MQKCTKFDFGWGSAPDSVGGAYSAPPDILAESNMQGVLVRGWKKTRREKREQDGREGTAHSPLFFTCCKEALNKHFSRTVTQLSDAKSFAFRAVTSLCLPVTSDSTFKSSVE